MAVGKSEWVAERTCGEASSSGKSHELEGKTVVYVGVQGEGVVGHLAFSDVLRDDACDVVARLSSMGIRVMLLSGDKQAAAASMGKQVGRSTTWRPFTGLSSAVADMAYGKCKPDRCCTGQQGCAYGYEVSC